VVQAAGEAAAAGFREYVRPRIDQRREEPGDDLLSYLISARDGDGVGLDDDAILAFASLMITAGSETTNHTIGNLLVNLLADEEQHQQARRDPRLALGAFFETMRHSSAIQSVMRTTSRDVEVCGETIPAGSTVLALLGAANRDDRRFDNPDRFDIHRDEAQQHLGFGYARHRCLGGFLAQAEVTTAVRHLLALPELRVREGTTPWIEGTRHRGPTELHVEFDAS
jgi:cytochrome P450